MRFKVLGYDSVQRYHKCENLATHEIHRLDLFVDGLNSDLETPISDNDIVGRIVVIARLSPYLEIATGVQLEDSTLNQEGKDE